ncbi:MAG: dynamin family protein [Oscillospiraceae bacterium]|nr:dynamin family protein [Oscillospiraceae bacterium]
MKQALDFGSYAAFKEIVEDLKESLIQLKEYCDALGLENTSRSIHDTVEKAIKERFEIAVVGEFKRGKSTIINALLGKEVLPADVLPATATLNRVTYSENPYVLVEYKCGDTEKVKIGDLKDYVTKLSFESEKKSESVRQATVYYDTEFCRNNVDIIDTPGLNDDEQMTKVTMSILPKIDAAVFVISANSPFSQFEKEFLEKKMLTSDLGRIIFAVNCFGTFSKEDEDRIVETVAKRIGVYVMEKAKLVMGENSKEFDVYKRKIGKPRVIGVYAKKALTAKGTRNAALLAESNFPAFENVLESILTMERGAISLQILANKIISSGSEIINSIMLRENALAMESDEFLEKYEAAIDEIDEIRTKKRAEFVKINEAAANVFKGLQPTLDSYWLQIEETAMNIIDDFPMSAEDLKRERTKMVYSMLTDKIKDGIENKAQLICEKIHNEITIALSDEAVRLQSFEDEFYASIGRIQQMFAVSQNKREQSISGSNPIMVALGGTISVGTGGLFVGLREAGFKGALLGGFTGVTGTSATIFLAGALGILGGPMTIFAFAMAGLVGTLTGKFAVDKILVQERIDKYKSNFKSAVKKQFKEMKITSDFSETVRRQIFASFQGLKSKIEEETEIILLDTQKTLDSLNRLKAEKKMTSDNEREALGDCAEYVGGLLAQTYALHKKLTDETQ